MFRGNVYQLLASVAWGTTCVVQRTAMEHLGPFTYSGIRFFLGSLMLLPFVLIRFRSQPEKETSTHSRPAVKMILGASCPPMLPS